MFQILNRTHFAIIQDYETGNTNEINSHNDSDDRRCVEFGCSRIYAPPTFDQRIHRQIKVSFPVVEMRNFANFVVQ
jgi:hypothetical protein